jgi:secernin
VPFFVHGRGLPEIVSRAGTFGKRVMPADAAGEDRFASDSYWWLFRELMDRVKGHPVASLPGLYPTRNRVVRARFDALEAAFDRATPEVVQQAQAAGEPDAAAILDAFTQRCVEQVLAALEELLATFDS